jgi:tetratricopeptide (TPR) repeat protein
LHNSKFGRILALDPSHPILRRKVISAADGYHRWSENYDSDLSDVLSVEDKVARAITTSLTNKLAAPAGPRPKLDPAAYRLYLQAAREQMRMTFDGYQKAAGLFREVTIRQPDFAEGYSRLAWAAFALSEYDQEHSTAHLATSADAAQKALSLDPENVDAKLVRAMLNLASWNWEAATADLQVFRRTPSNNVMVLHTLRIYYNEMGFPDVGISFVRRAITLDPLSNNLKAQLSFDLIQQRETKDAVAVVRSWLERAPNNPLALLNLCTGYALMDQPDQAWKFERQLSQLKIDDPSQLQLCNFYIDVASGNLAQARKIAESWTTDSMYAQEIAVAYMDLNDFDRASDWLDRSYERREPYFFTVAFGPAAEKYRATSPRWKTLTERPAFREWQAEHHRIAAELTKSG